MHKGGIALIEVMVSVAIIGSGLIAILHALNTCVRTADMTQKQSVALRLLDETLDEAVRSERLSPHAPISGQFSGTYSSFRYRWEKSSIEGSPLFRIVATVEWERSGRQMRVSGRRLSAQ